MPSVSFKLNYVGCNIINLLGSTIKKNQKIKKNKDKTHWFKGYIDDQ